MRSGRDKAFTQVLQEHGAMVSRIASAYEFDPDLQKDLTQDMAIAIWKALPKFEGRSSLKTFVARIAHYRGVSHVSKQSRLPRSMDVPEDLPSRDPTPEDQVGTRMKQEKLIKAVRRLPLSLRQVATLALEGFEAREIAETLGLSANNAAVRLNRAKAEIRKELQK